ncbi:unnamed protein product [Cylindrotheca closterium]|uniref:DAGKc domain-containing protein n=1 Tax=Cylindrotheca closterium TaxID=2856 RepID=A0AAD2CAZ5_9STRA|nr:unnamed protein product [Cylindrotheca closterium]
MASTVWPSKTAESVKLIIPEAYDPYNGDVLNKCFIRYNADKGCFLVVSEGDEKTLDIIDSRDIVGASVEVDIFGSVETNELRRLATAQSTDSSNGNSPNNRDDNEPGTDEVNDTQGAAILKIFAYPRVHPSEESIMSSCATSAPKRKPNTEYRTQSDKGKLRSRRAHHRQFQVAPSEDLSGLSTLIDAIRAICKPGYNPKDKLLVLVNPYSGTKKGTQIFNNTVAPMFVEAGIDYDYLMTTSANHAFERMKEQGEDSKIPDLSEYDGVVAVGGDGIIHEMFQGIRTRSDCDKILSKLKLGVVGSGTSNGLAKTLAHASNELDNAVDYAFLVAKGNSEKMDLSLYETSSSKYISFLTFSWSMIADIDIESEAIRFMGFLRMDIWGVLSVLRMRRYRARLSYLPPSDESNTIVTKCPSINEPIPCDEKWVSSESDFLLLWASQVTHAAEKTHNSPNCKLNDGVFEILVVRENISRLRMAMILLGLDSGDHANMPGVEFIRCSAYRLEPITPGSFNDLDGEVIEAGPVQAHVMPGAVNVFCTPIDK